MTSVYPFSQRQYISKLYLFITLARPSSVKKIKYLVSHNLVLYKHASIKMLDFFLFKIRKRTASLWLHHQQKWKLREQNDEKYKVPGPLWPWSCGQNLHLHCAEKGKRKRQTLQAKTKPELTWLCSPPMSCSCPRSHSSMGQFIVRVNPFLHWQVPSVVKRVKRTPSVLITCRFRFPRKLNFG
jgi:hypothetical protein